MTVDPNSIDLPLPAFMTDDLKCAEPDLLHTMLQAKDHPSIDDFANNLRALGY